MCVKIVFLYTQITRSNFDWKKESGRSVLAQNRFIRAVINNQNISTCYATDVIINYACC